MKRIIISALALLISASAIAQTQELSSQRLDKLRQRAEMQKSILQRQQAKVDFSQRNLRADNAPVVTPEHKSATATQWATEMPAQRWFPGEWEEVQAIVVTFPYNVFPAGHIDDEDYMAEIYLPGMGMTYKWNYYTNNWGYFNGGWGAVEGKPDVTDYDGKIAEMQSYLDGQYDQIAREYIEYYENQKAFRSVFVNLIDAIQQASQVWIVVWQLSDSTLIKNLMSAEGKPLTNYRFIECYTNAFWFRDCGPICFYYGENDEVAMLNFEYSGRACDDLVPDSLSSQTGLPNYVTTIEWEGGNCLVDGAGKLVTSDAIYDENGDRDGQMYYTGNAHNPVAYRNKTPLSQAAVLDSMQRMFGTTYILPRLRYDGGTGHVDLYADMWDENEFIFSQYPSAYSSWTDYATANNNIATLTGYQSIFGINYKKTYIPFPSRDDGTNFPSQSTYDENFTRSYSNHTFINNIIVQPCFSPVVNGEPSAEWDRANLDSLRKAYPGYTFYPIDIRSFDGYGGAIHCITKQIPADNPIRILHASTTRHSGIQRTSSKTIEAIVTNRSGIANVTLYWRVDEGDWHTATLSAGSDDHFSGTMLLSEAGINDGNVHQVEYYISATSNNGKTITKPMTASKGGFYTFDVIYDAGAGINSIVSRQFGQFYPNPANGLATINMEAVGRCQVSVVDAMGREVYRETLADGHSGQYTLDTRSLSHGIYGVRFTAADGSTVVRRLTVQ